ncbi:hypothetical protein [Marinicellulosiphila megalodicopiae]|uniref:hypothetical protein n=1 Tax=Marinicellulosiphila megalodicopiae TaxID=2724896 RepID=UPI003BB15FB7
MFKLISTLFIFLIILSSCNSTAQFQKSFENNQGVLIIPLTYLKRDTPNNIASLINHRLTLEMINLDTKAKISKTVVISLNNKYIVFKDFAPGSYEVVKSYYLVNSKKDLISEERIKFTMQAGEFTVLPDALNYTVYQDNAGTYWLTKKFLPFPRSESVKLENTLKQMIAPKEVAQ